MLGIDSDLAVVQRLAPRVTHVVQTDATDEQALARLGVADCESAVVAITGHIETSILVTLLLKRFGIERVIAKARSDLHGEILTRVGAESRDSTPSATPGCASLTAGLRPTSPTPSTSSRGTR